MNNMSRRHPLYSPPCQKDRISTWHNCETTRCLRCNYYPVGSCDGVDGKCFVDDKQRCDDRYEYNIEKEKEERIKAKLIAAKKEKLGGSTGYLASKHHLNARSLRVLTHKQYEGN